MELFKHQRHLLELSPDKYMLMWGTGSGKSLASIELCKQKGGRTLVVCPKSLVNKWDIDIAESVIDHEHWLVVSKEVFKKSHEHLIHFDNLIIDEAHFFSNYKSGMTKALLAYLEKYNSQRIYLLTATPWLSSAWNIYTYAMIFGMKWKWFKFNQTFFTKVKMGNRFIPVPRKSVNGVPLADYIAKLLTRFGNSIKLEDCFDVPEQIFQYEYFELTRDQRRGMDNLTDILPIVRFTKEHQICGGTLKGDTYTATERFNAEKLGRLLEIVEENSRLVIVCRYNEEISYLYESIKSKFPGLNVHKITGQISGDERHHVVEEINKEEQCVVLINASCSEGYGLPHIPLMVFYSYDFSLKNYIQMLGRIQRAGHIKKNVYLSLVVKDTIDEQIYKSVAINKKDFQAVLYGEERTTINNKIK
jgi:superfamily II DNA or RNA helicase